MIAPIGMLATLVLGPIPMKASPFPLSDVRLLGGPFLAAERRTASYLLTVDPDRLLHSFRQHSGLPPKGEIYGGWENSGLAGHSLGHYLTACAQEYSATRDSRFKSKVDYIVSELVACQKNRPDGYIAAMPDGDRVWAEVKKGEIRSRGFDLNGLWSPWYTHHKVFAGLLDAYKLTGNQDALKVAKHFADWAIETTKGLTAAQWEQMLGTEYGGMNDAMAELYALTRESKYLDLARQFYDHRVLDPLAKGEDDLPGKHSNTQIPKVVGLARLYELTGERQDSQIAEFFWDRVVHHHTYAIGGNSNHEYLGPPDQLADRLSSNTCETCNTYNMLKLTRHLFQWEPRADVADFYERAHLNHILASQNPDDGMVTYFMPLGSGTHREYSNPSNDWTCCHGSGMENHTKHADSVYFHHAKDALWVNLFIPSELNWRETGMRIRQTTEFPTDGKVRLTIDEGSARRFTLNVRHPGWAKGEVAFKVNGKVIATSSSPSSYCSITRDWKKGDSVEFTLPMTLHTEAMPDNADRVAVLYGPLALAADLGPNAGPMPRTPVLVTKEDPARWLRKTGEMQWTTEGVGRPTELVFRPFFMHPHNRYAVYFDRFTEEQWQRAEADYRAEEARQRDLEARTVDMARIGEMQPERDHHLASEKNDVRGANGRNWRTPLEGGWFEFDLKVDPAAPNELVMTYWGSDRSHPEFEILVDGEPLVIETQPHRKANVFFDETHAVPLELTRGKDKVRVRVQAVPGKAAGSVAGARMIHR